MHIINQTVREKTRILQISEASQKAGKSAKEEGQNYLVWLCRKENKSEECQVDLINAVKQPDADLNSYDMIGFASGIYFSKFHQSILGFAEKNLPDDKKVFLICTYGGSANYKSIEQILDKKRSKVIGKFGCKGYDTFGPFKLVGGIAKGHPDEEDIKNAVEFVEGL